MDRLPSSGVLRVRRAGRGRTTRRCGAAGAVGWAPKEMAGRPGTRVPGREGAEMWPPREKAGAEERSPSAPLGGPSNAKERGSETPQDEPAEAPYPRPTPL